MSSDAIRSRSARPEDWPRMREIFLEGITTGESSFETAETVPEDWVKWVGGRHEDSVRVFEFPGTGIVAWGALAPTSRRHCYRGVAEVQLYVAAAARGQGVGRRVLTELIDHAEHHALWMLQAVVFPENEASRRLFGDKGFREVGYREKIARMNGVWRDTLLLERRSDTIW